MSQENHTIELPFEEEIWKDIPDWKGVYQASTFGRIRRIRRGPHTCAGKILAQTRQKTGYFYIGLWDKPRMKTVPVHALVAQAFLGYRPHRAEIDHRDGSKANNRPDNLEYVTKSENRIRALRLGLQASGERSGLAKLTDAQAREIRNRHAENPRLLGIEYGVHRSTIRKIQTGTIRRFT